MKRIWTGKGFPPEHPIVPAITQIILLKHLHIQSEDASLQKKNFGHEKKKQQLVTAF